MPEIQIYNNQGIPLSDQEMKYLENLITKHLVEIVKVSEVFSVRAFLVGQFLAEAAQKGMTAEQIEVAILPLSLKAVEKKMKLTKKDKYAIQFSKQRSAERIRGITEQARKGIKETIWQGLVERKNPLNVSQDLFKKFGDLNRDWRRIAITEANIAAGEGYMRKLIDDQKERGKKVTKLLGQSAVDACPWCKENIHGKVFILVDKDEAPIEPEDPKWDTHLWPGKNNVGRGYAKRKWVVNSDGSKV